MFSPCHIIWYLIVVVQKRQPHTTISMLFYGISMVFLWYSMLLCYSISMVFLSSICHIPSQFQVHCNLGHTAVFFGIGYREQQSGGGLSQSKHTCFWLDKAWGNSHRIVNKQRISPGEILRETPQKSIVSLSYAKSFFHYGRVHKTYWPILRMHASWIFEHINVNTYKCWYLLILILRVL